MTKISVDKEELKTIRDNIDSLLEKGKQSLAAYTQQPIYESYDLNDKEHLIIEYLNKNPGNTKEQVTTGLSRHYSRMPIRDTIDALIERGLIIISQVSMLETFEEYGLSRSAEPVLDLLWRISYPILPLIYPTCYNKDLKDWRIVLENMPESNYKPKTEQITYDE